MYMCIYIYIYITYIGIYMIYIYIYIYIYHLILFLYYSARDPRPRIDTNVTPISDSINGSSNSYSINSSNSYYPSHIGRGAIFKK